VALTGWIDTCWLFQLVGAMRLSRETRVGAFDAKTRLSELLDAVNRGATFTITKRDRPVARLVAYRDEADADRADAVGAIVALRKRHRLGGESVRLLREEGRA
jgi:prevent-host-death family protein